MAAFLPVVERMWYKRKNRVEMTAGIPSPPFLTMAPRGAPIKKNIRQAKDRVNFRCHSISYFLNLLVRLTMVNSEVEMNVLVVRACVTAFRRILCFCELFISW